jgi:UDPglucose 6-dehydrogenase
MRIVEAAIESNTRRKTVMLDKIEAACGGSVAGKRLAVFGLTFKGQTDDMRESPSVGLIQVLEERGAKIRAYDPSQPAEAAHMLPNVGVAVTPVGAVRGADALLILTEWKDFTECDLGELAAYMTDPVMVDLRNLFDEDAVRDSGFRQYVRIGRKSSERRASVSERGGHRSRSGTRIVRVVQASGARHESAADLSATVETSEAV